MPTLFTIQRRSPIRRLSMRPLTVQRFAWSWSWQETNQLRSVVTRAISLSTALGHLMTLEACCPPQRFDSTYPTSSPSSHPVLPRSSTPVLTTSPVLQPTGTFRR